MIKLLKRLEDDFIIGRIWIDDDDGLPRPLADIGGVICDITTKQALLDAGIASCNPIDDDMPDSQWPMQCLVLLTDDDGPSTERLLDAVSANPRLVAAAKKFAELLIKEPTSLIGMTL